jgi:hypothetical protein
MNFRQYILTKVDNNEVDDTELYPERRSFVRREEIVGLVWGYIPLLGRSALWVRDMCGNNPHVGRVHWQLAAHTPHRFSQFPDKSIRDRELSSIRRMNGVGIGIAAGTWRGISVSRSPYGTTQGKRHPATLGVNLTPRKMHPLRIISHPFSFLCAHRIPTETPSWYVGSAISTLVC